jgi:hypothetical protein
LSETASRASLSRNANRKPWLIVLSNLSKIRNLLGEWGLLLAYMPKRMAHMRNTGRNSGGYLRNGWPQVLEWAWFVIDAQTLVE